MKSISGTTVYISGAMSGLPDLNYPAFNRVAKDLRALGYAVENPAENPRCDSWEKYMRLAIAQLVRCDEIHMLRGWSQSKGAKIERELAGHLGLVVSGAPA